MVANAGSMISSLYNKEKILYLRIHASQMAYQINCISFKKGLRMVTIILNKQIKCFLGLIPVDLCILTIGKCRIVTQLWLIKVNHTSSKPYEQRRE